MDDSNGKTSRLFYLSVPLLPLPLAPQNAQHEQEEDVNSTHQRRPDPRITATLWPSESNALVQGELWSSITIYSTLTADGHDNGQTESEGKWMAICNMTPSDPWSSFTCATPLNLRPCDGGSVGIV
jgi:hypothetical protein